MKKNDATKDLIIRTSIILFNEKGYGQTSIQDIMDATRLPKGAIYRRFKNKNDIALASFEKSGEILMSHFLEAVQSKDTATEKIIAMYYVYEDAVGNPPISGGCPLLNTAIESDYSFPELREKASLSYNKTLLFIKSILDEGINNNEFHNELNSHSLASFILAAFEGSIMASRVTHNNDHILNLTHQIKTLLNQYKI
ncbi:TetR/AcrR family transcriptional regulator [Chengkuizengella sp. SCS-71B]|uniref:TetR/AcrR family transcriptional regulator n=1 Tax=Chengkuizengella sp. SCS-71B TaxID=3115290 RepID=UPI0032C224EE